MEPTFYEDQSYAGVGKESLRNMKRRLTLDFNAPQPTKRGNGGKASALLSSPDLNMLKLASPELEKLIIQQNGVVTTTPTPTQFIFPKNVTEEQEDYARGFVDALNELRHTNSASTSPLPELQLPGAATAAFTSYSGDSSAHPTAATVASSGGFSASFPPSISSSLLQIKEEPQMVPSLGETPPLSPIDMASQERIKQERKRQRNRVAASKCRKRKLELIARLQDKAKDLKDENVQLGTMLNKLHDQVCQLKQQVMDHMNNGCQIMLSQDL